MTTSSNRLPREIHVLVIAGFIIALGYGIIAPVLPRFAASFGVTVTASSAIVSAYGLARLLSAPAGGYLTARLGERWVYLVGVTIVAVSTGAVAFARSYTELIIYRGLGGVGSVMFTVSATTLVVRISPPQARGRAGAAMGTGFLLGTVTGPAVGTALSGLGMRTPFIIYMVTLLAACVLVATMLPSVTRQRAQGSAVKAQTLPVMSLRQAWADSAYRAVCVSAFVNGWANIGVRAAVLPLFATTLVGAGEWAPGAMLTVMAASMAVMLQFTGRGVDRWGRKPYVVAGFGIAGLLTMALGMVHSIGLALIVCVAVGLAVGMFQPAQQAVLADVIGNQRSGAAVTAAFTMVLDLGIIIGPLVTGWIVDQRGYTWGLALCGVMMVASAAQWLVARETNRT